MSEVRLPTALMSFFFLSLGVNPSKSVALHLHVAHDGTSRQITSCNDYKFVAFSYSICNFAVNGVTGMFHHKIMMTLHSQCTGSYRILRNVSISVQNNALRNAL